MEEERKEKTARAETTRAMLAQIGFVSSFFLRAYPNVLISSCRCDTGMLTAGRINGNEDLIFTWTAATTEKKMLPRR